MVRLFWRQRERTYALQFLSVHFPVPADRPDRLLSDGPAWQSGARDMAGAGVAGLLFRQQLAVRAAAVGVDHLQLPHRPGVDLAAAAPRAAIGGPDDRRRR